jgi:AcrR family transcriptional regulator
MPPERAAAWEALPVESEARTSEEQAREGAMEGALIVAGRLGYRAASVRAILEYSGGHRRQFYELFASKEDCFEQAYSAWLGRVGTAVLEAAVAAPTWVESVRAGLVALFRFVAARPDVARSLFVEAQVAGGRVQIEHEETMERIAAALDSVRGEIADQQPPAATGMFVVGGIEASVCDALTAGDPGRVWDALPELMHLAVGSYMTTADAEAAYEEAKEMLARDRAALARGGGK